MTFPKPVHMLSRNSSSIVHMQLACWIVAPYTFEANEDHTGRENLIDVGFPGGCYEGLRMFQGELILPVCEISMLDIVPAIGKLMSCAQGEDGVFHGWFLMAALEDGPIPEP